MATHSSILAWRIPSAEEPGGLYSTRSCRESDTAEHLSTCIVLYFRQVSNFMISLKSIYSYFIIVWPSFHDCFLSLIFSVFKTNLFPHAEFCIFCSNMFCIAFLSLHALKNFFLPLTMYFSVYRYFFPGIHYFLVEVKSKILSTLNSNDSLSSKGMEDALPSLNL